MSEINMDDVKTNTSSDADTTTNTASAETPATAPVVTSSPAETTESEAAPVVASDGTAKEDEVKRPMPKNVALYVVIAILLLALAGLATKLASLNKDKSDLQAKLTTSQSQLASVEANPQVLVQKQTDSLIGTVGKLMNLPTGETPTVAAVSDVAAAQKQSPFFANAQNGDKVLLYVKAGEAILYRPSTNKIILVAPLTFNNAQVPVKK